MAQANVKVQSNAWKTLVLPSLLILLLFLGAGYYAITSILSFYYRDRAVEASILAKSYASILSTVIDVEKQIEDQLSSTLRVAGVMVTQYSKPFSQEVLISMTKNMEIDVIYIYDQEARLTHSSDGKYIGWIAPEDHPVRNFLMSGKTSLVEDIREDTESGVLYKYAYHRFQNGGMVQVGILANNIKNLYSQFEPQYIVDKLSKDTANTLLALQDTQKRVIAASDFPLVGDILNPDTIGLPISETQYKRVTWEGTDYLAFHLPITIKDERVGSLVLFYNLTQVNLLMLRVSRIVSIGLLIFFCIFLFSFLNIRKKSRRILNLAYHDELTGLPNLRYFHQYMMDLKSNRIACIVINPAKFRFLNMLYGYDHGDMILTTIGNMLTSISEQYKRSKPFRLSDDRFLMVFHEYRDTDELQAFCSELLRIRERNSVLGSIELCLGISQSIDEAIDSTRLLKEALIALDATTVTQQIQYYNEKLGEGLIQSDAVANELKLAITSQQSGLSLVYQPIIESKSGIIRSFEALARLESQKLGMISPLTFIPIAEQRQLIIPLGKRILSLACDFIAELQTKGCCTISVAVNISAIQLMHESFIPDLIALLKEKGVQAQNLELELTESVFAQDMELLSNQLELIRALGIRISIDDFGTGYSSLSRLGNLPIDTLKLDKQFVDKLGSIDVQARGLASDIISMTHHIGKVVVAEGVENQVQRDILIGLECDLLQGYLLSKPLPASQALVLLEHKGAQNAHPIS